MRIGFSTGCLHKHLEAKEAIRAIKNLGCKIIELGFSGEGRFFSRQLSDMFRSDLNSIVDFATVEV